MAMFVLLREGYICSQFLHHLPSKQIYALLLSTSWLWTNLMYSMSTAGGKSQCRVWRWGGALSSSALIHLSLSDCQSPHFWLLDNCWLVHSFVYRSDSDEEMRSIWRAFVDYCSFFFLGRVVFNHLRQFENLNKRGLFGMGARKYETVTVRASFDVFSELHCTTGV